MALNVLEDDAFGLGQLPRESTEAYHVQLEAMKLGVADARRYIADPDRARVPTRKLLSKQYAAARRTLIGETARPQEPGDPIRGGTIYLCTADRDGMMVSYIQSNFSGFGSGVVVPGAGIALQNRGWGFSLEDDHPNLLEPGKRPYHTIIPGFLTQGGQAVGPFGVTGGHTQPQAHVQVIANTVDYGMNPQAALDAPRWVVQGGLDICLEDSISPEVQAGLAARGHQVVPLPARQIYGRGRSSGGCPMAPWWGPASPGRTARRWATRLDPAATIVALIPRPVRRRGSEEFNFWPSSRFQTVLLCIAEVVELVLAACTTVDSPTRVIVRDKEWRALTEKDLRAATGEFSWELREQKPVPGEATRLHQMGRAEGSRGNYEQGLALFAEASALAPDWPYPPYDAAYTYLLMDDPSNAEQLYDLVDRLAPRGFFTTKPLWTAFVENDSGLSHGRRIGLWRQRAFEMRQDCTRAHEVLDSRA